MLNRIVTARSSAEIEALKPDWEALVGASAAACVYQRFEWNQLAAECFAETERPYVVLCESEAGMAIVPACVRQTGTVGMLGEALFDYRDVLVSEGTEGETALRLGWKEIAKLGLPLRVRAVRDVDAEARWRWAERTAFCNAPCILPQDSSEQQYVQQHHRLVKKFARPLQRLGAEFREYPIAGDPMGHLPMLRMMCAEKARDEASLFRDARRVEFILKMVEREPECFELFGLEREGKPISLLLALREKAGAVRRAYTNWHDPEWGRYSPGRVLLFEIAKLSLRQGIVFDLQTGEQPYKAAMATRSVALVDVSASAEQMATYGDGAKAGGQGGVGLERCAGANSLIPKSETLSFKAERS